MQSLQVAKYQLHTKIANFAFFQGLFAYFLLHIVFRLVVTRSDENPPMHVIHHSKFPPNCAHERILVTINMKTSGHNIL